MITEPEDEVLHFHEGAHGEFFVQRGGNRVAELSYQMSGEDAMVGHTWVDPKLRGGALGQRLVEALVAWARRENRKIIPMCSYVRAVFARTPGYADVQL
jgi:predicted GNAT family acetyltransferase